MAELMRRLVTAVKGWIGAVSIGGALIAGFAFDRATVRADVARNTDQIRELKAAVSSLETMRVNVGVILSNQDRMERTLEEVQKDLRAHMMMMKQP